MIVVILGILATTFLGKFVATAKNRERAIMLDKIADSLLAVLKLQNPGSPLYARIQFYEDKLFELLMAEPSTTDNEAILRRVTAAAIDRAMKPLPVVVGPVS